MLIKRILTAIKHPGSILRPNTWCNDAFIKYIKKHGGTVGEGTRFISPDKCHIDINRADYIRIGKNCCLSVVSILAHDYSWYTLLESNKEILPDAGGEVIIGDNCFIGYQSLILKNTVIGDNVIIGARSVVKGYVPSNTVWAGVPAKQICTLGQFVEKRKSKKIEEAIYRRNHIIKTYGRRPSIEEMGWFGFLFLERSQENYDLYIKKLEYNGQTDCELIKELFFKSEPHFNSFEDFLSLDYK